MRICVRSVHHVRATVIAVLSSILVLAVGAGAGPVWAAAQQLASLPAPPAAPASAVSARPMPAPFFATKIILPETSIDGPAFSSIFGSSGAVMVDRDVIGWTGTDAAHHLNVETSTDESSTNRLHFGNKRILHETSPFRPDVTQASESAGGQVTVAWTGTDASHSLNVLFDVYGSKPLKLTLHNENSFTAPAVLQVGSTIFLAWTGTNAGHSLNILPISLTGTSLVPGKKTILSQFSSNAGPHLAPRGSNTIVLNWTSRANHLVVATSPDGVHFPDVATSVQTSAFAPDTVGGSTRPEGADWIGWTGTDAAHHLNVQGTASFPSFPNPAATKIVLSDTAFGGPALALLQTFGAAGIAWTGTDSAHHLNIADFEVVQACCPG